MKKYSKWICIAWHVGSPVAGCKATEMTTNPISEKTALRRFKKHWPGMRDYTVHPSIDQPETP